jgi:very-short-patch-repair endonuclease
LKPRQSIRGTAPEIRAAAKALRWDMTPAERVLWDALKERQLAGLKFRNQHPVGSFVLDFYCPERRLVVEVDGGVHDDPDQFAYDAYRTTHLETYGLTVLRLRNEEILTALPSALARILAVATSLSAPDSPAPTRKTRRQNPQPPVDTR